LVLPTTSWPLLQAMVREIADARGNLGAASLDQGRQR
jgi:hypothetical protein